MKNTEEVFIDVNGYEGMYKISNKGRLMSYRKRSGRYGTGSLLAETGKILKENIIKGGYVIYKLYDLDGEFKQFSAHRLVYMNFVQEDIPIDDGKGNYLDVSHLDGNPQNNTVENLILETHQANVDRSRVSEVKRKPVKAYDKEGNLKFEFKKICDAFEYGFNGTGIRKVCNGQQKYHGNLVWEWVK